MHSDVPLPCTAVVIDTRLTLWQYHDHMTYDANTDNTRVVAGLSRNRLPKVSENIPEGMSALPVPIPAGISFTVSARGKAPSMPILRFLAAEYARLPLTQVESVFGFVEPTTLYGGRRFIEPELSPADVNALQDCCIGIRLPLSNLSVTREEFEASAPLLTKYHRKGNSVITVSDELAGWIRADFPLFEIEASVIKNINTIEKLESALKVYDTAVLPMQINLDKAFLERIPDRKRVTLFANAGCALTCPAKICYGSISKANKFKGGETACSFGKVPREIYGMLNFDLTALAGMGFVRFKMLRMREHGLTGY